MILRMRSSRVSFATPAIVVAGMALCIVFCAAQTSAAQTSAAQTSGAQTSGGRASGAQASGGQASGGQTSAVPRQKVILDTDIGDDIDDAFALALALRSPELELLQVNADYGNTPLRALLLDRFLAAVGRSDIPVAVGVQTTAPNIFSQRRYAERERSSAGAHPEAHPEAHPDAHAETHPEAHPETHPDAHPIAQPDAQRDAHRDAVQSTLDLIRQHPGEITLIAIGPFSNAGSMIDKDPETFRKLRRVVLMGGSVYLGYGDLGYGESGYGESGYAHPHGPDAEWNVSRDIPGARKLLASGVPIFMMPLDSTQLKLDEVKREALFQHDSPLTDQLVILYHQWGQLTPTLFDPMAVGYAIDPELCPTQPLRISVDDAGYTRPQPGKPNVEVCLHSDPEKFFRFYMPRILGP